MQALCDVRRSLCWVCMQAWKFTVEYDGSRYHGWQEQKNAPRTVMGTLRNAVEEVLGAPMELQGAGRTDAGVHALGQVLHVKGHSKQRISPGALKDAVNHLLGHDLVVLSVEEVPERFHARHHAEARSYLYRISTRKNAFSKRHVWWVKQPLNGARMQEAVAMLAGRHDFSAFRADDPSRPDESPIVVVESAVLEAVGDEWQFRITASHFIWRQVRRIVGALVQVGAGDFKLDDFAAALDGDIRWQGKISEWTAPAAGLFLESVRYPADLSAAMKPARKAAAGGAPSAKSGERRFPSKRVPSKAPYRRR